jgi:hypothetical protein
MDLSSLLANTNPIWLVVAVYVALLAWKPRVMKRITYELLWWVFMFVRSILP